MSHERTRTVEAISAAKKRSASFDMPPDLLAIVRRGAQKAKR